MTETWTCAECNRQITVPDDRECAEWELVDDGSSPNPEDWPVYCLDCYYGPEVAEEIRERAKTIVLSEEERAALAGKFYEVMAQQEGRN